MPTKKKEIEESKAEEIEFTKEQILKSKRYRDQRDLINALLEDGNSYSLKDVNSKIDKFMEEGVK